MHARFLPFAAAIMLLPMLASTAAARQLKGASELPKNDTGENQTMGGTPAPAAPTPMQMFVADLKLDVKTQGPAVDQIFQDAAKEGQPIGVTILQLRQRLLNADLTGNAEDAKAALDAYAEASAKMAALEARTFAKIYATLKPSQQANATQAFALMAGIFQFPSPSSGGSGSGGRGGRGGR